MLLVQVVDRVGERLRNAGRAHCRERRAVLDDAPLAAMPPDEMRDVMHVRARPGRDRREAHRRERREDRRRAPVRAVLGEERERRRAVAVEARSKPAGVIPSTTIRTSFFGRHQSFASVRNPAYRSGARLRNRRRARAARAPRGSRERARARARRRGAPRRATSAAVPPRVPPRRSAPLTICAAPSAPASPPSAPATMSPQPPGQPPSIAKPIARTGDEREDDARRATRCAPSLQDLRAARPLRPRARRTRRSSTTRPSGPAYLQRPVRRYSGRGGRYSPRRHRRNTCRHNARC